MLAALTSHSLPGEAPASVMPRAPRLRIRSTVKPAGGTEVHIQAAPEKNAERTMSLAEAHLLDGETDEAERLSLGLADHEDGVIRARALHCLGEAAVSRGLNLKAARCYREAILAAERAPRTDVVLGMLVRFRNDLAILHRREGRLSEAEAQYVRAIRVLEEADAGTSSSMATLSNNLATLCLSRGASAEAMILFEKAIAAGEAGDMPVHDRARLHHNAGVAAHSAGNMDAAVRHLGLAISLARPPRSETARRIVDAWLLVASIHLAAGRNEDALSSWKHALEVVKRFPCGGPLMEAILWQNMGVLHARCGRLHEALHAFSEAVEARESCAVASDADLADAHYHKAVILSRLEEHEGAQWHMHRADACMQNASRALNIRAAAISEARTTVDRSQPLPEEQTLWASSASVRCAA